MQVEVVDACVMAGSNLSASSTSMSLVLYGIATCCARVVPSARFFKLRHYRFSSGPTP
jgi:hypothetical protein